MTVITVVYNNASGIERTLLSVLGQTYRNLEYIVMDGGSSDGTLDIIKRYEDRITSWISEPDKGIYDAMNKGSQIASGYYVLFMNSGDEFYNENVLQEIAQFLTLKQDLPDVVYGDTSVRNGSYATLKKVTSSPSIKNAMPFCHQSVFVKTALLKKYQFDISYRVIADREMITRMYLDRYTFAYHSTPWSVIEGIGFSNLSRGRYQSEENRMLLRINAIGKYKAWRRQLLAVFKDWVMRMAPPSLISLKRKYKI
ncbi:glycosyltransferase family 2 protein [Chitinophaga terrae (ex Kim and Jung 2007)]|uniref:glycosyltransferase family 2 protein n=1 Tax=Chitinophaga terrae (ex Kim and Jung 2007) TaxID=408074 RepID=UPI00145771A3|nr:glycosyltransferase family 2 protein [Chitinophaga terrae (ex Kim and Jung 2007)]